MLSAADRLAAELGANDGEKSEPRRPPRECSDGLFTRANAVRTIEVLDWLGVEHDEKFSKCVGCGEDGALICADGGVKCLHDRCAHAGPPNHRGFRTNADLVAQVRNVDASAAAKRICERFGVSAPRERDVDTSEPPTGRFDEEPETAIPGPLPFAWVREFGELHKPEPLRWLFRDMRTNKPFLRAGECAVLGGDGGVGKGFFWLTLAACIALNRDVFGTFRPEQAGRVALLVGEDSQRELHHRLHRIANAFALDKDEIEQLSERVGIFPLAGQRVNLLALDGSTREPIRTSTYDALVAQLGELASKGGFEWSLVGLDPLARFGAANVETDQSAATAFVQALESMAEALPGKPAVGVSHHSSGASVSAGKPNIRGVTGLRNAFRLAMTLDAYETTTGIKGVLLRNDKNNLAPKADPLWLVRLDNEPMGGGRLLETAGVLRRATEDESKQLDAVAGTTPAASKEQREQAKETAKSEKFVAELNAVEALLPFAPAYVSRDQLLAALAKAGKPCTAKTLQVRIEALGGRVLDLSGGSKSRARQYARPAK